MTSTIITPLLDNITIEILKTALVSQHTRLDILKQVSKKFKEVTNTPHFLRTFLSYFPPTFACFSVHEEVLHKKALIASASIDIQHIHELPCGEQLIQRLFCNRKATSVPFALFPLTEFCHLLNSSKKTVLLERFQELVKKEFFIANFSEDLTNLIKKANEELSFERITGFHAEKSKSCTDESYQAILSWTNTQADYLQSFTILDLSNLSLTRLPSFIKSFTHLLSLDVRDNFLFSLSDEVFALRHLETLNLSHNRIRKISEKIQGLPHLKHLYIDRNLIADLPPRFHEFSSRLEVFDARSNFF